MWKYIKPKGKKREAGFWATPSFSHILRLKSGREEGQKWFFIKWDKDRATGMASATAFHWVFYSWFVCAGIVFTRALISSLILPALHLAEENIWIPN